MLRGAFCQRFLVRYVPAFALPNHDVGVQAVLSDLRHRYGNVDDVHAILASISSAFLSPPLRARPPHARAPCETLCLSWLVPASRCHADFHVDVCRLPFRTAVFDTIIDKGTTDSLMLGNAYGAVEQLHREMGRVL